MPILKDPLQRLVIRVLRVIFSTNPARRPKLQCIFTGSKPTKTAMPAAGPPRLRLQCRLSTLTPCPDMLCSFFTTYTVRFDGV